MVINPLSVVEELIRARCDLSNRSTQFLMAQAIDEVRQEIEGLHGKVRNLEEQLESRTVKFEIDDPDEVVGDDHGVCNCKQCTCQGK